eukprot:1024374-Pyramimonas_sp.AAC.1
MLLQLRRHHREPLAPVVVGLRDPQRLRVELLPELEAPRDRLEGLQGRHVDAVLDHSGLYQLAQETMLLDPRVCRHQP